MTSLYRVELESITSNTNKSQFNADKIAKLSKEILESNGLVRPLVLKPTGFEQYEVLAGHLEYHAAIAAQDIDIHQTEVNAVVIDADKEKAVLTQVATLEDKPAKPATPKKNDEYKTQIKRQGWEETLKAADAKTVENGSKIKERVDVAITKTARPQPNPVYADMTAKILAKGRAAIAATTTVEVETKTDETDPWFDKYTDNYTNPLVDLTDEDCNDEDFNDTFIDEQELARDEEPMTYRDIWLNLTSDKANAAYMELAAALTANNYRQLQRALKRCRTDKLLTTKVRLNTNKKTLVTAAIALIRTAINAPNNTDIYPIIK